MFIKFCLASMTLVFSVVISPLDASERPNILLITADDMGFDDLSLHSHPFIKTPNIDELASNAVQFSDFSVTPVCSTTRASLLTGRNFYKTGVSGVHGGRDYMHLSETLLSDMLKTAGYRTGIWGKWHIGKSEGYLPWDRGFDEAYYAELYRHQNSFGFLNGERVEHDRWVSEVVTDYAIDFMQSEDDQPFFAYVSYLAPHEPWLAPKQFTAPLLRQGLRPAIANLYGMVNEMDYHIGRLMSHLKRADLIDNTIVIFLSDNGPWWDSSNFGAMTTSEWKARNPSNMYGNKGQSWQNGIRSPLFVHWPSNWKASSVSRYVDVKDIVPTLLDLLDISGPPNNPIDGTSFLPYLQGRTDGFNPRVTYIASHEVTSSKPNFNQWAPIDDKAREGMTFASQLIGLRTEQYKLLLNPAIDNKNYPTPIDGYVLFDMVNDPLERKNVIEKLPQVAQSLKQELEDFFFTLLHSHDSYLPPVYFVGKQSISVVNGFGPSSIEGNTRSGPHHLKNMREYGDKATYTLQVESGGTYKVYLSQSSHNSVGLKIKMTIADSSLTYEFNEFPLQLLGTLSFPEGEQNLSLEVLANNSKKAWSSVDGLRRFFLIPKDSDIQPDSWPLPN
ncbi:sulfatase-like hydrolase/transferase [Alteromonas oceanisediminis]|uniref:sulfatase-like hydrolase/transferase n=1 Tax=Alteromonas oceanisediminis TaxID=2836180 RepID=UPI001BDB01CA|nr:sulfatase-like hydrolase/transferase [Alteromonas oceanisediminis]MBT0586814.1 sulfatase-like hydrolase/transferase [Alteromonas oceanisediminis]